MWQLSQLLELPQLMGPPLLALAELSALLEALLEALELSALLELAGAPPPVSPLPDALLPSAVLVVVDPTAPPAPPASVPPLPKRSGTGGPQLTAAMPTMNSQAPTLKSHRCSMR